MAEEDFAQVSREEYIKGIAISTAVFCLPSITRDLSWLHGLVPLPVFYYLTRFGRQQAVPMLGVAALCAGIISAVFGSLPTLLFSFTVLPLGFILADAAYRKETVSQAGLKGIIYLVTIWIAFAGLYAVLHQSNPYKDLLQSIDQGLEEAPSLYFEDTEVSASTVQEIELLLQQLRQFIAVMFPALLLASVLFTVWLNLVLGNWLLKKKAPASAPWNHFRNWRLPEPLVWIAILAILGMLLPFQFVKIAGQNAAFVIGVLYLFQGLAILSAMLAKWLVPTPFRIAIYALLLIQDSGIILLAVVGLADVWADFRKIRKQDVAAKPK